MDRDVDYAIKLCHKIFSEKPCLESEPISKVTWEMLSAYIVLN